MFGVFAVFSAGATAVVFHYGDNAESIVPIIYRAANLLAAVILVFGSMLYTQWQYVAFEVPASALTTLYSLCGLIDSCDNLSIVSFYYHYYFCSWFHHPIGLGFF
jgi:predicted neutral ceramidase superfamily lipid hydrolase